MRLSLPTLTPLLLLLSPFTFALSNEEMLIPAEPKLEERQIAAGGGAVATTLAPSQYPTTSVAGSLLTVDGTVTGTWFMFTQTFATTALGSWPLGDTPMAGEIGLGSIQGTVGVMKTKRNVEAVQTPSPKV